jgi:hypothetical protein
LKAIKIFIGLLFVAAVVLITFWSVLNQEKPTRRVDIGLSSLALALEQARTTFGSYPTGEWREISSFLQGENSMNRCFFDGRGATNRSGELLDPWGVPYAVSRIGGRLQIKSAGPDQKIGTDDDIATTFAPRNDQAPQKIKQ